MGGAYLDWLILYFSPKGITGTLVVLARLASDYGRAGSNLRPKDLLIRLLGRAFLVASAGLYEEVVFPFVGPKCAQEGGLQIRIRMERFNVAIVNGSPVFLHCEICGM